MSRIYPVNQPYPKAVAYLTARAYRLTRKGRFEKQQAARTLYTYFCSWPAVDLPKTLEGQVRWRCPVAPPWDYIDMIVDNTGLGRSTVYEATTWLEIEKLIEVDRDERAGRRKHGALSTTFHMSTEFLFGQ